MKLNYGDFRQFMTGSFVKLKPFSGAPNGCNGVVIQSGDNLDGVPIVKVNTSDGIIRLTWEQAKELFVVEFPSRRLFNHGDRALLYSRHVVKQFGKGPNETNSGVFDPVSWMTPHKRRQRTGDPESGLHGAMYHVDVDTWNSLINGVYPTVKDAIDTLSLVNKISVAVSPEYAVVAANSDRHTYPVIHLDHVIGVIKYPRGIKRGVPDIVPVSEDFNQDCRDFIGNELKGHMLCAMRVK